MEVLVRIKFRRIVGCTALVAASLCLARNAAADTLFNGAVWTNAIAPYTESTLPNTIPQPGTPADITFTITNSTSSPMFDMYSSDDSTLLSFLTNSGTNGNSVNFTTGATLQETPTSCPSGTTGTCGMNNDVMEFWGSAYLQQGETYNFVKDDGMLLYIDGNAFIDAQAPSAPQNVSAVWNGTSGVYNFNLWYDEVNGAPGQLSSPDFAVTPEPSSLLMLGTGLFGLAFLLFRRSNKTPAVVNA